jgi:hypothetical protein
MSWPVSQDYNEAIQNPATAFADAELCGGEAVRNALGLPMPCSGNFADVYQFVGASGARWALKCFTRQVPGLQERYHKISKHLIDTRLPFTVDFKYLAQGIRIGEQWYPILKMQWVEGQLLNEFVRANVDRPGLLDGLALIWQRMARRLGEARIAHADLQHGNIILVPSSKSNALAGKLIDYDGMWVPALATSNSGEVGHPNYQHPQRLRDEVYSAEVDRLPLLAIACALRCLAVAGRSLWDRHDNGDNLLFREADLARPCSSVLLQELWSLPDATAHALVGHLTLGLMGTLDRVPLLHELMSENRVTPLSAAQEEQVEALLGLSVRLAPLEPAVTLPMPAPPVPPTVMVSPEQVMEVAEEATWTATAVEEPRQRRRRRRKTDRHPMAVALVAGSVIALLGVIFGVAYALTRPGAARTSAPVVALSPTSTPTTRPRPIIPTTAIDVPPPPPPPPTTSKPVVMPPVTEVRLGGPSGLDRLDPAGIKAPDRHKPFTELAGVFASNAGQMFVVAISPDGKYVAATGLAVNNNFERWQVCLWDSSQPGAPLKLPEEAEGLDFSPDSKYLTGGRKGKVWVWDIYESRLRDWKLFGDGAVFSPDGKTLAVMGQQVELLDISGPEPVPRAVLTGGRLESLSFSRDGKTLAGVAGKTVQVWDVSARPPRKKFSLQGKEQFWHTSVSPDGTRVAAGDWGGNVYGWDISGAVPKGWSEKGHRQWANSVGFAPDGKSLISTEGGGSSQGPFLAIWWNAADGSKIKDWDLPERCACGRFDATGRYLAFASHTSKVYVLRLKERAP